MPGLRFAELRGIRAGNVVIECGARLCLSELADQCDVPPACLCKVLKSLARRGLLAVHRGVTGGYELAPLALFGLGTAPALLGVSVADELLARNRAVINRLTQVFLLAVGLWFLWTRLAR